VGCTAQVVVLYVEQEESVRRQMMRAKLAAMHNTRVMDAGTGDLWELRATDVDSAKCRRRYEVFKVRQPSSSASLGEKKKTAS
jgi:hypothetical protein